MVDFVALRAADQNGYIRDAGSLSLPSACPGCVRCSALRKAARRAPFFRVMVGMDSGVPSVGTCPARPEFDRDRTPRGFRVELMCSQRHDSAASLLFAGSEVWDIDHARTKKTYQRRCVVCCFSRPCDNDRGLHSRRPVWNQSARITWPISRICGPCGAAAGTGALRHPCRQWP